LEYCFVCEEYPCKKYEGVDLSDSFITHKNQFRDMDAAKRDIEVYKAEQNRKIAILEELLEHYNDGRRKGFFCIAVNLLDLADVEAIMAQLRSELDPETSLKEKANLAAGLFQAAADEKGIVPKLRK